VPLSGDLLGSAARSALTWGIALGLLVGKPLGIVLASWLAVTLKLARLPESVTWRHMVGIGIVAGIGFTVALFIADLAFDDPRLIDQARVAILASSLVAGVLGYLFLAGGRRPGPRDQPAPA
jgi:NhaA family Na+:H+ antiporter